MSTDQRITANAYLRYDTNRYRDFLNHSHSFESFVDKYSSRFRYLVSVLFFSVALAAGLHAQDFGFGFDDEDGQAAPALPVSVKVGGEIGARFLGYVHDFSSEEKMKAASLGDVVYGALNFSASAANVDAFIALNLSAASISDIANSGSGNPVYTPLILDEAYLRAYFGPVNIEAGLRKLTWGKADSMGPLDVINPIDYTDMTKIPDIMAMKIARPLVRISWNMDGFSKLEAVFLPGFAGHRFAHSGRWAPSQFSAMRDIAITGILGEIGVPQLAPVIQENPQVASALSEFSPAFPDTSGLEYFQTGLRFTTTIGPADIGAQYFYGNLFRPDFVMGSVQDFLNDLTTKNPLFSGPYPTTFPELIAFLPGLLYTGNPDVLYKIKYNRYHQIGLDYAQVLFDFNIRGEFAVHLTEDLSGDDGSVRNPFLAWSLGFDRSLFWGVNANVQCTETIRLLNDRVSSNPALDCEAGTDITSTSLIMQLSKKFLKDEFECKLIAIWGIEDSDCYIIPAISWNIRDLTAELAAGVFAGKETGEFGQYWENSFVKIGLKYSF